MFKAILLYKVDPKEEINKANVAVAVNFGVFLAFVGLLR